MVKYIGQSRNLKIGKGVKGVICITDNNKEFNSVLDAAKYYNVNQRSIGNILIGLAKQTRNKLTFKYK